MNVLLRVDNCGVRPGGGPDVGLSYFQARRALMGLEGLPVVWAFRPRHLGLGELAWLAEAVAPPECVALCGPCDGVDETRLCAVKLSACQGGVCGYAHPGPAHGQAAFRAWSRLAVHFGGLYMAGVPGPDCPFGPLPTPDPDSGLLHAATTPTLRGGSRGVLAELLRDAASRRPYSQTPAPLHVALDMADPSDGGNEGGVRSLCEYLRAALKGPGWVGEWAGRAWGPAGTGADPAAAEAFRWALSSVPAYSKVLDAGCGFSELAAVLTLRGCLVKAVDRNNDGLYAGHRKIMDSYGVDYAALWMDVGDVPRMTGGGFDAAVSMWSFPETTSACRHAFARKLAACVRPGGLVLAAVASGPADDDVVAGLARAGLVVESSAAAGPGGRALLVRSRLKESS